MSFIGNQRDFEYWTQRVRGFCAGGQAVVTDVAVTVGATQGPAPGSTKARGHDRAGWADALRLRDVARLMGPRSFGGLLLLPTLLVAAPLGGAPSDAAMIGSIAAILLATQLVAGRTHAWMPWGLRNLKLSPETLNAAADRFEPLTRGGGADDDLFGWARQGYALRLTGIMLVVTALAAIPAAANPLGAFVSGLTMAVLTLGLLLRSGAVSFIGWILTSWAVAATYCIYAGKPMESLHAMWI